jgi:DNA polymerase (family 10)
MDNQQIAKYFQEIGDLLEIDGANRFRVLAYRNAAETLRNYGMEMKEIYEQDPASLKAIPGIGFDLKSKIEELLTTGKCQFHQELVSKYGQGVLDILAIRGIGPKKVKLFYTELGVDNLEKLKAAAQQGKLRELPRMGEKSETEILKAIEESSKYGSRMLLSQALPLAESIVEFLKPHPAIEQICYAGSLRRGKETIGDLDILTSPYDLNKAPDIILAFQKYPEISNIIASGPTKSSVILNNGVQVDLRVVEKKSFGAALHYFTGSKDHNVFIRDIAKKAFLRINEYGIFRIGNREAITVEDMELEYLEGETEEKLFKVVGLNFIPPTLRENRGEFDASLNNKLPNLVQTTDLQGDLHINSNYGLGKNSLTEIAEFFIAKKFNYIAINDLLDSPESRSPLTLERLQEQFKEIDQLNKTHQGKLKIYKAITCTINQKGELNFPDDLEKLPENILAELDFISISLNSGFTLPEPVQTARLINAMQLPKVKMLCHPTSRILNQRPAINANFTKVIQHAAVNQIILEINSRPDRLDLPDNLIKVAKEQAAPLSLNSDIRDLAEFDRQIFYGLLTSQRGWLEKSNLINCQKQLPF